MNTYEPYSAYMDISELSQTFKFKMILKLINASLIDFFPVMITLFEIMNFLDSYRKNMNFI